MVQAQGLGGGRSLSIDRSSLSRALDSLSGNQGVMREVSSTVRDTVSRDPGANVSGVSRNVGGNREKSSSSDSSSNNSTSGGNTGTGDNGGTNTGGGNGNGNNGNGNGNGGGNGNNNGGGKGKGKGK